jgi:hypothetical protein
MITVVLVWAWLGVASVLCVGWAVVAFLLDRRWAAVRLSARWCSGSGWTESGLRTVFIVRRAQLGARVAEMGFVELTRLPDGVPQESVDLAMAWAEREADRRNNELDDLASAPAG